MEKNTKIILGIIIVIMVIIISAVALSISNNPYAGLKNQDQVKGNFELYDKNNDGYLDINDLEYRTTQIPFINENINEILEKYDKNNDGKLNLTEVDNWMS